MVGAWLVFGALAACGGGTSPGSDGGAIDEPGLTAGDDAPPGAPSVTILAPQGGAVLPFGETVALTGHVTDDRDSPTQLSLVWSSDVDGSLAAALAANNGLSAANVGGLSAGYHSLTLAATDLEGLTGSASVSVLVNAAPTAPVVAIEPAQPTAGDDLVAVVLAAPTDANRGAAALALHHRWWVDGADSGLGAPTVPAGLTERGQVWQVQVWAEDGHVAGAVGADEVVIANTPPTCDGAAVLPSAGTTVDTFECVCADRADADGDPADTDTCVFAADGQAVQIGSCTLPPGVVQKGQSLTCTYTPHDGADAGAPAVSDAIPILNAPPTPPAVSIDPPAGGLGTTFTCQVIEAGVDPDADQLAWEYTWLVDGQANPGETSQAAIPSNLVGADGLPPVKGSLLRCRVTASDGIAKSVPADSPVVVLGNSPPTGGKALVSPAVATEASTLSCDAADALDPDDDEVGWLYGWHVHGTTVSGQASQTLTGAHFDKGDLVGCVATPTDGQANGLPVQAKNPVTIQNTLPLVESVVVTPAAADQLGVFTCAWSGWLDPDLADPPQVALAWQALGADGSWADHEGATGVALPAAGLPRGTQVRCVATPSNGAALGVPAVSAPAEVVNTLPAVGGATITPSEGGPCAPYTCQATGVMDPDPDETVLVAYRWTVNDQPAGAPKPALDGVLLAPGDVLRCHARATDGSLDDEQQTLYGPEVTSAPVTIGNTPPQVEQVTLSPAVAIPADTLTCAPAGLSDADGCQTALEVVFKWYADGALVEGAAGDTLAAASLALGTEVLCQVVVGDGWEFGSPKLSNPAIIGPADPVVTVAAPEGATGAVTCELVQEATHAQPLDYSFHWTFNGGPEEAWPQTLPAGTVTHCDVVTCRTMAATADGSYSVGSNTASEAFPLGPGCDDDDPCTEASCAAGGGCSSAFHEGPCDDGDPCSEGEHCEAGFCVGGVATDCDDANPCTADACVPPTGCVYAPADPGPCGPNGVGTCQGSACCVPQCAGLECGADGCGGSCGECEGEAVCVPETGLCVGPSPGMTVVSASGFWMGCNDKDDILCKNDEYPFRPVFLSVYQIDLRQVTASEYEACVEAFTCFPPGSGPGCNYQVPARANHPMNCVNWYDAEAYCASVGKRLCTEAEWEKAARGDDGRKFPWGFDDPTCDVAVVPDEGGVAGCGTGGTAPVGSKPDGASPYGLLDMSGEVYDWTADWYWDAYYTVAPQTDPPGPDAGSFKVRRGGAYDSSLKELRVSSRQLSAPNYGAPAFGVRCCDEFPPQ